MKLASSNVLFQYDLNCRQLNNVFVVSTHGTLARFMCEQFDTSKCEAVHLKKR